MKRKVWPLVVPQRVPGGASALSRLKPAAQGMSRSVLLDRALRNLEAAKINGCWEVRATAHGQTFHARLQSIGGIMSWLAMILPEQRAQG